jgi:hypothetical protein
MIFLLTVELGLATGENSSPEPATSKVFFQPAAP